MRKDRSSFTVAAVQAAPVFFDREKSLEKAVRFIEEAADQGAVIIGLPELFIAGHSNLWYLGKTSNPLRNQSEVFKELVRNGVTVPGPATERLGAAARKAHAYLVIGITEVDPLFPGTLYLSQLVLSDKGEIMGVHRKLVTTLTEKLVYSPGDGSHLQVFDTRYGKLSALNCGEHAHSLFKYALLSMGAQIHVASWPSFPEKLYPPTQRESVQFRVRQFAHEGKLFVINSCSIADEQNVQYCCGCDEEREQILPGTGGGSAIVGPGGEYLAGPVYTGECVVAAEIRLDDALPGKQDHNVLGHYSRYDVLSLNFNRQKLSPFMDSTGDETARTEWNAELKQLRKEVEEIKKGRNEPDLKEE